jgi:hypothetical protein
MDPGKFRWISCEDTYILMRKTTIGQLAEWQPIAEVFLRQVYAAVPAKWFATVRSEPQNQFLGRLETMEEAKGVVENALGAR